MKNIAVVFNGGTISMKIDERIQAAVPSLSGEEILSLVTGVEDYAKIETHNFSGLPSPHVTPEIMFELSKFVAELVDRKDIDGVVVTHGTDTLEETAYFLDLVINTEKPIVVTGAMRSSSELGYDGPFNLATSICTAIADDSKGKGVLVCFNGELNSAKEVTKGNSMALNAFVTPTFGPLGVVDNNRVIFYRNTPKGKKVKVNTIDKKVELIKCVSGMNSDYINFLLERGIDGIVIEGLGRGNVPPTMMDGIRRAVERNVPIVLVSRCFEGRVYESYGYEGGGKQLKDLGIIFGDNMVGQKARIKLLLALCDRGIKGHIKEFFE